MPSTATVERTSFLPFCCYQAAARNAMNAGIALFQAFSPIPVWGSTDGDCIKVGVKMEPACGNGNFLLEILKQKLERVKENSASEIGFMYLVIQAVMSIYGVDIQMDNVVECVDRLYDQVEKDYYEFVGHNPSDRFRWTIYSILGMNMTCGDSLYGTTDNGKPIMIYEWKIGKDGIIYCDGYRLSDLVAGDGELNEPVNRKRYLWFISALSKALAA